MSPVFKLSDVKKTFGAVPALNNISVEINQGDIIALIGPSGSGKTTLLKLLNAQHLAEDGIIQVSGQDIKSLSHFQLRKTRSKIAYIPQDLGLVKNLKVFQNILLGKVGTIGTLKMIWRFLFPPKPELETIHSLLDRTGIPEKLYAETSLLSGGQQQRVAVTRALYQGAHTILADEPISAVDPARARSLIKLLIEISQENDLTLIMSIHNIQLALEFFPRIVGLKAGEILFDSSDVSETQVSELYKLSETELSE